MKTIQATINGIRVEVPYYYTILQAAQSCGIEIPTLCHLKHLTGEGTCRICMVEVKNRQTLVAACSSVIADGDVIETESEMAVESRRGVLDLLLSYHSKDCDRCKKKGDCKLEEYCLRYGVYESFFENLEPQLPVNDFNSSFTYDANRCILCQRCTNVCHSLVGKGAIDLAQSGMKTLVSAVFNMDWSDPYCERCGNCVPVCPVGALVSKTRISHTASQVDTVQTTCPNCAMGCQLRLVRKGTELVDIRPANLNQKHGLLCSKGMFDASLYGKLKSGRNVEQQEGMIILEQNERADIYQAEETVIRQPMIRTASGELQAVSWEEALQVVTDKIKDLVDQYGGDVCAGLASAQLCNEDFYLFGKFFRAVLGSNHLDHYGKGIGEAARKGFQTSLGFCGMMNPGSDLMKADVILVVCHEKTLCHPVLDMQIRQAARRGKKLIVIDPKGVEFTELAGIYLKIRPGTMTALCNGMLHVIFEENLMNRSFMAKHTQGGEELRACVRAYDPGRVSAICDLDERDLIRAARLYGSAERAYISYQCTEEGKGDGIIDLFGNALVSGGREGTSMQDSYAAMSICNLALVTGHIGRSGCGVNVSSLSANEQGARDMGILPDCLPGGKALSDFPSLVKIQRFWQQTVNRKEGMGLEELQKEKNRGSIHFLHVLGSGQSLGSPELPDRGALKALAKDAWVLVQDSVLSDLAKQADVVLPVVPFLESQGTFTSMERSVHLVNPAWERDPSGKTHWEILGELMTRMGSTVRYESAEDVWNEIRECLEDYRGVSYQRIRDDADGIFLPCPEESHKGSRVLFRNKGEDGTKSWLLSALEWSACPGAGGEAYPITLTTCPMEYHYRRMELPSVGRSGWRTLSKRSTDMSRDFRGAGEVSRMRRTGGNPSGRLERDKIGETLSGRLERDIIGETLSGWLELSQTDGEMLGIRDGDEVEVTSVRAVFRCKAQLVDTLPPGVAWMPEHFVRTPELWEAAKEDQLMPGYKEAYVRITKIK